MYIKLLSRIDKFIFIKLFDNSATTKWFDLASKFEFERAYPSSNIFIYDENKNKKYGYLIKNSWNKIKSTLEQLTSLGFKIPFTISKSYDFNQNTLNMLHRFFTYNNSWYGDMINTSGNCKNPFDPDFTTTMSYDEWNRLIGVINDSVHLLENFTQHPSKKILEVYPVKTIIVEMNNKFRDSKHWVEFDLEEQEENFKYFQYLSINNPLVLLDGSILGKSYLQSFIDGDDPSCKDCTGRFGSFGNFTIDLNRNRSKIYNSPEFKNWLSKYNIVNPPLEFPIGMVIDHNLFALDKADDPFKGRDFPVRDVIFSKTI